MSITGAATKKDFQTEFLKRDLSNQTYKMYDFFVYTFLLIENRRMVQVVFQSIHLPVFRQSQHFCWYNLYVNRTYIHLNSSINLNLIRTTNKNDHKTI